MAEKYRYKITHPDFGTVEVTAEDKLHAIYAAARAWGVPWTSIARACTYERLELVKLAPAEKKPEPKRRPATQKKGGAKT